MPNNELHIKNELGLDRGQPRKRFGKLYLRFESAEAMAASLQKIDQMEGKSGQYRISTTSKNTIELQSEALKNIVRNPFDTLLMKGGARLFQYDKNTLFFPDDENKFKWEVYAVKQINALFGPDAARLTQSGVKIINEDAISLYEQTQQRVDHIQQKRRPLPMLQQRVNVSQQHSNNQIQPPQSEMTPPSPKATAPNNAPRLVCIDFDETIVNGHFFKELEAAWTPQRYYGNEGPIMLGKDSPSRLLGDGEAILNDLLNGEKGPKNPNAMRDAIRGALQSGNHVAITSLTLFPEVVVPTLQKIGLRADEIAKICIVGGFPVKGEKGKTGHMKMAMQHFGMAVSDNDENNDNDKVMLIDDDDKNIGIASQNQFQVSLVPKEPGSNSAKIPEYIQKIIDFSHVKEKIFLTRMAKITSLKTDLALILGDQTEKGSYKHTRIARRIVTHAFKGSNPVRTDQLSRIREIIRTLEKSEKSEKPEKLEADYDSAVLKLQEIQGELKRERRMFSSALNKVVDGAVAKHSAEPIEPSHKSGQKKSKR